MQKFIFGKGNVDQLLIVTLKSGHKAALVIKTLNEKDRAAATAFWKKSVKAHEPFNAQLSAGLWRQVGDRWVPNCYSEAMADPDREPGFAYIGPVTHKKGHSSPAEKLPWVGPLTGLPNMEFTCSCGYCTNIGVLASCSCRWCGQGHSIMPDFEKDRQWLQDRANQDALALLDSGDMLSQEEMGWPEEPITEKLMEHVMPFGSLSPSMQDAVTDSWDQDAWDTYFAS